MVALAEQSWFRVGASVIASRLQLKSHFILSPSVVVIIVHSSMCPARQDRTISEWLGNGCPPILFLLGLYILHWAQN